MIILFDFCFNEAFFSTSTGILLGNTRPAGDEVLVMSDESWFTTTNALQAIR